MKQIVAVSGGVDSVVLLDMLADSGSDILVAHFDHGIRQSSSADARFVEKLASRYGLEFVSKREDLGYSASEDQARVRRYDFLLNLAKENNGEIFTAHHLDDLVETIALNMIRGISWRGLATMGDERIKRPLLKRTKSELIDYAINHKLEWCEDETNSENKYLRNKIRRSTALLPRDSKYRLYDLWREQGQLKNQVGELIRNSHFPIFSRYFLTMIENSLAKQLIYDYLYENYQVSLLESQLRYLLNGIKVGRTSAILEVGQGIEVKLTDKTWSVQ